MQLNASGSLVSSNIHTKEPLEPAGDKQTHVDRIRIWTHVECEGSLASVPIERCKTQ